MAMRKAGPTYIKRRIRMNSIQRGVLGGDKFWLTMFALGYAGRAVGKVTKRGPGPVVFSEKLAPGEAFEVRHIDPG